MRKYWECCKKSCTFAFKSHLNFYAKNVGGQKVSKPVNYENRTSYSSTHTDAQNTDSLETECIEWKINGYPHISSSTLPPYSKQKRQLPRTLPGTPWWVMHSTTLYRGFFSSLSPDFLIPLRISNTGRGIEVSLATEIYQVVDIHTWKKMTSKCLQHFEKEDENDDLIVYVEGSSSILLCSTIGTAHLPGKPQLQHTAHTVRAPSKGQFILTQQSMQKDVSLCFSLLLMNIRTHRYST